MGFRRIMRHLLMPPWRVRVAFPPAALAAIERAIAASERLHRGQIRFAVEGALHGRPLYQGESARERALEVFSQLRMWDTDERNGVLIYLLLADRAVEVVADRGAHLKVDPGEWRRICRGMETELRAGHHEAAVLLAIRAVTQHLAAHFPPTGTPSRQLPDEPVVL
ncbi:MAG TPA: TPM domain-containing protein [Steroidobacteraceae bacterium]|nr:TPM domain-containing protein [Steroidobacteraceae bacterium]